MSAPCFWFGVNSLQLKLKSPQRQKLTKNEAQRGMTFCAPGCEYISRLFWHMFGVLAVVELRIKNNYVVLVSF